MTEPVTLLGDFPVWFTPANGTAGMLQASEVLARPAVASAFHAGMLGDGVARPGLRAEAEITIGWGAGFSGHGFEDIRKVVLELAARLASPGRVAVWEWPVITPSFRWWLVPAPIAEDTDA